MLKDAELVIIDSVWGHVGTFRRRQRGWLHQTLIYSCSLQRGGGANPTDVAFITKKIQEFLA